jgi:competence protein ComEA
MADSPTSPVPPAPPTAPPPVNEAHVSRRTQLAALVLLLAIASLIGWRWYSDRYGLRPSELQREATHRVDINRASKSELLQIPGIGPQTAEHIVSERESKGGFASVDDLRSIHGIGDATLNKIRPWLTIEPTEEKPPAEPDRLVRKPAPTSGSNKKPGGSTGRINVNKATLEELKSLPNIGAVIAQRIVAEREKKPFKSVDDLRRVSGIGVKRLDAIREMVAVE